MAVSLSLSIKQNSQSIANNTSNVTVTVTASWTYGSFNRNNPAGHLTIDGVIYNFTSDFNYYETTSGSQTIFTKTVNVKHNSDGTKHLQCSAAYATGVSSGKIFTSASKTLTTIARASTLSASNGTLGTTQTLTVARKSTNFTHTISYKCGDASGKICTEDDRTSISWTPPIDFAEQNTTGTSVSITFTIITHNGNTNVGTSTKTISCAIPSSVKPSCELTVTDATSIADTYGQMVKGLSQFKVDVKPTLAQNSPIASYKIIANGATYTSSSVTTDALKTSGTLTVSASVTDKRGRTGSDSVTVQVLDYSAPTISRLSVGRCYYDKDTGACADDDQGDHIKVTFSADVTRLDNKNSASYKLRYKRFSDGTYEEVDSKNEASDLFKYNGLYSVENGICVFEADTGSSYNIEFTASDSHNDTIKTTTASTAYTLMHWNVAGNGMGIGKVSELQNVFDVGMQTRHYGGILHPLLEPETNLDDVRIPNTYIGENISSFHYTNCPVESGTFTLIVEGCGDSGQVRQTYINCSNAIPQRFVRFYYKYNNVYSWGPWMFATTEEVVLYEDPSGSDAIIPLTYSAANYKYLEIYYMDNNGRGCGYTKVWNPDGKEVHLQLQEAGANIFNRQTIYEISSKSITPYVDTAGYVKLSKDGVVSVSMGTNYIKIVKVVGLA